MRRLGTLTQILAPALLCAAPAWAADYLSLEKAQQALFPPGCAFLAHPVTLDSAQRKAIREASGVTQRSATQAVWRVMTKGEAVGWFLVDNVIGKHEYITYATALSNDGRVLGLEIMSYRETHGGQVQSADWRRHFTGKTLADPFKLDRDVPNISGATLSCRNLLDGVKRLLALQAVVLNHE